jgi:hypothetical protein
MVPPGRTDARKVDQASLQVAVGVLEVAIWKKAGLYAVRPAADRL